MIYKKKLFIFLFCFFLVGSLTAINSQQEMLPDIVEWKVVYISQRDSKSCATTALAMLISHYEGRDNSPLDKELVWKLSKNDEKMIRRYGNDVTGLKRVAEHFGYQSQFKENLTFYDLELFLSQGILVILFVRENASGLTTHAILLTGYDRIRKVFFINDSNNEQNKEISFKDLESRWSAYLSDPRKNSIQAGFIVYPKGNY